MSHAIPPRPTLEPALRARARRVCTRGLQAFAAACFLLPLGGCATGSGAVRPVGDDWSVASLYPLSVGNAWSYIVDTGSDSILTTVRVSAIEGSDVVVRSGVEDVHYVMTEGSLGRTGSAGAVLKAPVTVGASWPSGASSHSTVTRRIERIEVPGGSFTGCAEVLDEDASTGKRVTTVYCPGVGPVQVLSELSLSQGSARVTAELKGHALAPKYIK